MCLSYFTGAMKRVICNNNNNNVTGFNKDNSKPTYKRSYAYGKLPSLH